MEATDDTAARGTTVVRYFLPAAVAVDEIIIMVVCYAERVIVLCVPTIHLSIYYVGKNRKSVKIDELISANIRSDP